MRIVAFTTSCGLALIGWYFLILWIFGVQRAIVLSLIAAVAIMIVMYVVFGNMMVWSWGRPETSECPDCDGWGVVKMDGTKFHTDARTMSHVLWARGNKRDCKSCQGRGSRPVRGRIRPRSVTGPLVDQDLPSDPTIFGS